MIAEVHGKYRDINKARDGNIHVSLVYVTGSEVEPSR
jgi:hypothetical protein